MQPPFLAVVAEDFEGVDNGELTLIAGTLCIVTMCEEDGWFTIHTKEHGVGIFPGSYMDEISEITLPCFAKVQKAMNKNKIGVGKIVQILDIQSNGWLIEYEDTVTTCTWDYLDITTEQPESINLEPIEESTIPEQMENQEIAEFEQKPMKVTQNFATVKTKGPNSATRIPEEKRESSYKRPVSIFGNYQVNSTFDIVFDKQKDNVYSVDINRRTLYVF